MRYVEQTNKDDSRYKITIEISESDMINLKMTEELKQFIQRKLSGKTLTDKLFGLLAIVGKVEEKEIINLN